MFDWLKKYDTLDEIPEENRGAFQEKDGKYQLVKALDPAGLKSTLEKQKTTIAELKTSAKRFDGLDLDDDALASLADDLDELVQLRHEKEAGELGAGEDATKKIEEAVKTRLDLSQKKHDREIVKLTKERDSSQESYTGVKGKLNDLSLQGVLRDLASKNGVKEHSTRSALLFGKQEFTVNDDGDVIDRTDAGRTPAEWMEQQVAENAQWTVDLKASGSGGQGGDGGGSNRIIRRSEMQKLSTDNPAEAAKLMASVRNGEAELRD